MLRGLIIYYLGKTILTYECGLSGITASLVAKVIVVFAVRTEEQLKHSLHPPQTHPKQILPNE